MGEQVQRLHDAPLLSMLVRAVVPQLTFWHLRHAGGLKVQHQSGRL